MSKNLKDIIKQNNSGKTSEFSADMSYPDAAESFSNEAQLNASEIIAQYGRKSENELMDCLAAAVSEQKQNGTFDSSQTESIAANIMPMLNEEQAKKLTAILKMIE